MTIVAAFDLATAAGVCDGAVSGKPRLWSWYLDDAGTERPARLFHLAKFLRKYFETQPCDLVVYEAPMPLGILNATPKEGRKGFKLSEVNVAFSRGAIGVLEMTCAEYVVPVESASVQDARASVLGWRTNRSGENTKKRVVREVTKVLGIDAKSDNEADAFVLWQYKCNLLNPRLAVLQQPLFRGAP